MKISVIICTYNRSRYLADALASLRASRVPDSVDWEVLVVDNNSTDGTRAVAEQFAQSDPTHFRYLFEPAQGKSHALNRGVRESGADILAFTDDDVKVDPEWLQNLTEPLRAGAYAGAGGRTFAMSAFSAPRWLAVEAPFALAPLALFDRGDRELELREAPFGNNMAFRREMFAKYGWFITDLLKRPVSEDSEFGERLIAGGERLCYRPSAVLYHLVPPERVSRRYFLSWWHDKARSDLRVSGSGHIAGWRFAGIPIILFRRLARWTLQSAFSRKPAQRFYCQTQIWSVAGAIRECYRKGGHAPSVPAGSR